MGPHIYRVDKFKVPAWSRAEFIERVERTHERLRAVPGFILDAVLERADDHSHFSFVTITIWESRHAVEAARTAVIADGRVPSFNRQEMLLRFGIEADFGNYHELTP
jgi:hypothetical protein